MDPKVAALVERIAEARLEVSVTRAAAALEDADGHVERAFHRLGREELRVRREGVQKALEKVAELERQTAVVVKLQAAFRRALARNAVEAKREGKVALAKEKTVSKLSRLAVLAQPIGNQASRRDVLGASKSERRELLVDHKGLSAELAERRRHLRRVVAGRHEVGQPDRRGVQPTK